MGGGGVYIFIYSCSVRLISFKMNLISKEFRRAEHEYMNIPPPPPPINALVTPLSAVQFGFFQKVKIPGAAVRIRVDSAIHLIVIFSNFLKLFMYY